MKVDFKSGLATVVPVEGKGVDPTGIRKAIRDSGFTPRGVTLTAVGVLARHGDQLALEMSGPVKKLVLAGGEGIDELTKKLGLRGQRIRVTGKLHPSHAEEPPGLTVDTWEEAEPAQT